MRSWRGANVVRLALNEQCWLGIGGRARVSGAPYRAAVADAVARLNAAGFVVVLDLHRSAPGRASPAKQEPMPDRDHSVRFWSQVAATYRGNLAVMFDLFNEPFPDGGSDTEAWRRRRDGGCSQRSQNGAGDYAAAGMNELITAVRATGARNVVLAGGPNYPRASPAGRQYSRRTRPGIWPRRCTWTRSTTAPRSALRRGHGLGRRAGAAVRRGVRPGSTITKGYDSRCPRSAIGGDRASPRR